MARKSILSAALNEPEDAQAVATPSAVTPELRASSVKPSRLAKLHVGGYFDPADPIVMQFQKLKVDLRRSQQDMLLEALADFVAKHQAASAFRGR